MFHPQLGQEMDDLGVILNLHGERLLGAISLV